MGWIDDAINTVLGVATVGINPAIDIATDVAITPLEETILDDLPYGEEEEEGEETPPAQATPQEKQAGLAGIGILTVLGLGAMAYATFRR